MSLYEITGRLAYLREMIESEAISEEDAADTMEAILQEQEDGYENAVKWIRDLEAGIEAVKAEAEKLAEKRKALENRKERVRDYILRSMQASGQTKVKAGILRSQRRSQQSSMCQVWTSSRCRQSCCE